MVSSWSEFLSYGCELYVDGTKVTFGTTPISASSWITVYIPSEENTNTGSNGDGYTHAMPGKLSDYASLSEAIDRVNLISWYCTSYPSTTNDAVLLNVTSFMSALVSVDSYEWSVSGSYYISVLNSYIDQLE
jgi:hypothetical protein